MARLPLILVLAVLSAGSTARAEPASPSPAPAIGFIGTAINVADRERAVRFYTEGLGLKLAATLPMRRGTETILQFPGAAGQPALLLMHDGTATAQRPVTHGNAFSRVVFSVDDLTSLAARLDRLGFAHEPIRDSGRPGYRIMMARDPDGYRLEMVQHPTSQPRS